MYKLLESRNTIERYGALHFTIEVDLTENLVIAGSSDGKDLIQLCRVNQQEIFTEFGLRIKGTVHQIITKRFPKFTVYLVNRSEILIPSTLITECTIQIITGILCLNRANFVILDRNKTKVTKFGIEIVHNIALDEMLRQQLAVVRHRSNGKNANNIAIFITILVYIVIRCTDTRGLTGITTKRTRFRVLRVASRRSLRYHIHTDIFRTATNKLGHIQLLIGNINTKVGFHLVTITQAFTHVSLKPTLERIDLPKVSDRDTRRRHINQRTHICLWHIVRQYLKAGNCFTIIGKLGLCLILFSGFVLESHLSGRSDTNKRRSTLLRRLNGSSQKITFPIATTKGVRSSISTTSSIYIHLVIFRLTVEHERVITCITIESIINSVIVTERQGINFNTIRVILRIIVGRRLRSYISYNIRIAKSQRRLRLK